MATKELKNTSPDITILIVNRNAASYLEACLKSIIATLGNISAELILVDAMSTDTSVQITKSHWPSVKMISIPEEFGYVKGNNIGLRKATGRYTMFLNSDTVIYPNALQELISFMDDNPQVGIASGSILNTDGSDQGVVRRFPTIMNGLFGRRSWLSRLFPNNHWYKHYMQSRNHEGMKPFQAEILSACSMVVRTDLAQQLGGWDERFRFYWVDAEFCTRIVRKGFHVYCVPKAKIMHHEGKGGSTSTFKKRLQMNRAFNDGAYLAYVEYHQLANWDPRRIVVKIILTFRMLLLVFIQFLRPSKATSSGGKN